MNDDSLTIESDPQADLSDAQYDDDSIEIVTIVKSCSYDPLTRL